VAAQRVKGKTTPRLWTPPQCVLTRRTSLGYAFAQWCEMVGQPLLPHQRWWGIHALELGKDRKTLRFRVVLTLMSRQCGKTELSRLLCLYKLFVMNARLVLGVAQSISMARENMTGALDIIYGCPWLAADLGEVMKSNGNESFRVNTALPASRGELETFAVRGGGRYKIAAANRRAGRGLSVDHLSADEVREWRNEDAWAALRPTLMARPNSQACLFTNAGDTQSTTLHLIRESCLAGTDPSLGIFEWSAPDDADPLSPEVVRQACPALGYLFGWQHILSAYHSTSRETYETETLCRFVDTMNTAISYPAWTACARPAIHVAADCPRDRLAVCFDAAPDGLHACLAVAGILPSGEAAVELAGAWTSTERARAELPALLDRIRPRVVCWYPGGPAAALTSVLRPVRPPSWRAEYVELTGNRVLEVCQELADLVRARRIAHPGLELLDTQIRGASRKKVSDGWRFERASDEHHVDGVYAAAGAISAALAMPEVARARIRLLG
jgi:hypothetical protein